MLNKMISQFQPNRLVSYDKESILNEIKRVIVEEFNGVVPLEREFDKYARVKSQTIRKTFGSWANALKSAGPKFRGINYADKDSSTGKFTEPKMIGTKIKSQYTTDQLYEELKKIWDFFKRPPKYSEFNNKGSISVKVYEERFGSWYKAIEAFHLKHNYNIKGRLFTAITPEMLLSDLRKIALKQDTDILTFERYEQQGGAYPLNAFQAHFGKWQNALEKVGLKSGRTGRYANEEFFDEIQRLWEKFGRQPTYTEMYKLGRISARAYQERFGSWVRAIHEFCADRQRRTH